MIVSNLTWGLGVVRKNQGRQWWLKIDLKELIENVYVAPQAADWFVELTNRVIQRYGLEDL